MTTVDIRVGDCRTLLRAMPAESVDCVVTSPPYFGLRDYGGGEAEIGKEPTPAEFIAALVDVFREVRRVLKPSGTAWVNLGDSYAGSWGAEGRRDSSTNVTRQARNQIANHPKRAKRRPDGFKAKDLMMLPARLAIALCDDGWRLRSDIIWHKPNAMPESITDRPTSAHEHVFLLTKARRYFYDAAAIAEPSCAGPQRRRAFELARAAGLTDEHFAAIRACGVGDAGKAQVTQSGFGRNDAAVQTLADEAKAALGGYTREFLIAETRNARNVWTIPTKPYRGAHYAVMPSASLPSCRRRLPVSS